jgi:hypothetical protein
MRKDLLSWQNDLYPDGHRDRLNLALHLFTWPIFVGGLLFALATPVVGWVGLAGLVGPVVAMALQGRGHKREHVAPVPFESAGDVLTRIFAEQLVTFPRFLLSGRFFRAWRG